MERHMRVLLALMLVLARLASCADSQPSVLRVRHAGAKSGSRQLMCRCGGPPPPPPPPPPADCTDCADGKYLEASCDRARNRDRVCTFCLSCGAGEYRFGCAHTSAGSCSTCSIARQGNTQKAVQIALQVPHLMFVCTFCQQTLHAPPRASSPHCHRFPCPRPPHLMCLHACIHSLTYTHACMNTY